MKKDYTKSTHECNVTFNFPEEIAGKAKKVHLVSDFNEWSHDATPMKKTKNGIFSVSINLPVDKHYQYRYLIDDTRWENDPEADEQIPTVFGDAENSVVIV
jgi:1,4-alpha-glucan branching enzyme